MCKKRANSLIFLCFLDKGWVIVYSIEEAGVSPLNLKPEERGGHGAVRRCLVKGSVLRSVACLPTHPVLPIAPSQRIYIIHRDFRIYMGIYMCGDIYGSMYVWRRERARPPLRLCGVYVDMWPCSLSPPHRHTPIYISTHINSRVYP